MIETHDIVKVYRVGEVVLPVLHGVSLRVEKGEMVALMGASGSGKSTFMNILGLLDEPTSGEYVLDGKPVSRLNSDERASIRNSKIGFVFQSFNLLRRTSAIENVMMPFLYAHPAVRREEARARALELMEKMNVAERSDHEPSQLSGGQQQRVAIARSLVLRPAILLADEPTGNLDSKTSAEVLAMLRRINKDEGITILLVTHDAGIAEHADRTIRFQDGKIVS